MNQDPTFASLQPTIAHAPGANISPGPARSTEVSSGRVALIVGTLPRFSDEIAELLRDRLRAACLILIVGLGLSFTANLFRPNIPLLGLRAVILAALIGCAVLVQSRRPLALRGLRTIELFVFGIVIVQLSLMMSSRMLDFARAGDAVSANTVKTLSLATWSVLILIYGMFIPNTWRRAAAILIPVAGLPYLLLWGLQWQEARLAGILRADHAPTGLPALIVIALITVYGTHTIQSVRREAFRARRFGQYVLKQRIGGGGMGEVFEAEHQLLKRPCALKLIRHEQDADEQALARFELEVRATAQLTHANTIEIYDFGRTADGTFYYVMELLRGLNLEDLVQRYGPLPPGRVVYLLRQVCGALREAHAVGLIHRDIKPANIFSAERGGVYDVAKLLDFGLVRQQGTGADEEGRAPKWGRICGSPLYMAPEQARNSDAAEPRSDLYAVGTVAYYLLTGKPPFPGETVLEVLAAHSRGTIVPPSRHRPDLPTDLETVVLRCLEKDPDTRYSSAVELERALAACACADQWSEPQAADWWQGEVLVQPTPAPLAPSDLDETIQS